MKVSKYGNFILSGLPFSKVIEVISSSNVAGYEVIPKALVSKAPNCHSNVMELNVPYEQMSGLIGLV